MFHLMSDDPPTNAELDAVGGEGERPLRHDAAGLGAQIAALKAEAAGLGAGEPDDAALDAIAHLRRRITGLEQQLSAAKLREQGRN